MTTRGRTVHGEEANAGHRVLAPDDLEVETYLEQALHAPIDRLDDEPANPQTIIVLDFGGQYAQLIARRIRELNVYSVLLPHDTPWDEIERRRPVGIILSGGPASVYDDDAPQADPRLWEGTIPVLGICYGVQLMAHQLGGRVAPAERREYGPATIRATSNDSRCWPGCRSSAPVWMSHGDSILEPPPGFRTIASSESTPVAAMANDHGLMGLQFHPEVVHTPNGREILANFALGIAGARGDWTPARSSVRRWPTIRAQVGEGRVICALSGGVDSAVAATLVHRAVGDQLTCIYVDTGLMRKRESELLRATFEQSLGMQLRMVDARDRFLVRLRA